jgi:hypothetical protein
LSSPIGPVTPLSPAAPLPSAAALALAGFDGSQAAAV